eukprot:1626271-Amphidinium_carterae.1
MKCVVPSTVSIGCKMCAGHQRGQTSSKHPNGRRCSGQRVAQVALAGEQMEACINALGLPCIHCNTRGSPESCVSVKGLQAT